MQKGFRPANELGTDGKPLSYPNGKPKLKVVSQKGEVLVGMKDGVEYVLRFGEIYRGPEDDENSSGDSRYIYAFARVNENLLDQPVLAPVPSPLLEPVSDSNNSIVQDSNGTKGATGSNGKEGEPSVPRFPHPVLLQISPPSAPPSITPLLLPALILVGLKKNRTLRLSPPSIPSQKRKQTVTQKLQESKLLIYRFKENTKTKFQRHRQELRNLMRISQIGIM